MARKLICLLAALAATFVFAPAHAAQPLLQLSGAIFTSDISGAPVNLNHYNDKQDVYLNGGPGDSAPDDAAGLPAGVYAFQVTDPSGKVLLSSDAVECRLVTVDESGRFVDVAPSDDTCAHNTGVDAEDGGITVQLFPYDDTPNNGGVYKVWLTPYDALLDEDARGTSFGFVPADSKVDNFKVKANYIVELDTRFWRDGQALDGMLATWTDTLGATNRKYSQWNPAILAFHEAHVEAVEQGTHYITVADQAGCAIQRVLGPSGSSVSESDGAYTVKIAVKRAKEGDNTTYFVDVYCG